MLEIYLPEIAGRAGDAALVSDISVSPQGSAAAAAVSVSHANASRACSLLLGVGGPLYALYDATDATALAGNHSI